MESVILGIQTLGINTVGLVAQIVNITLLLIILRAVLYKPILRMLDQRAERIKEGMNNAEAVKLELARTRDDYAAAMAKARDEAQGIIAQALDEGQRLREAARAEARQEAEALVERARAQITRDREEASRALRAEVADLAVLAAGRIVAREFDRAAHLHLIDDVLREVEGLDLREVK